MKKSRYEYPVPEHQADAVLNQANPVSGTQYEVLATTRNVRILGIQANVTWTVQPTPLQIHLTIDGQTIIFNVVDPVSTTIYFATLRASGDPANQALDSTFYDKVPFLMEGRSVRITAETTGGTVSNLSARVIYARW